MRYIAFIDILGFGDLIENTPLHEVLQRMHLAVSGTLFARHLNVLKNDLKLTGSETWGDFGNIVSPDAKCLDCFSFSDTFVLSTSDDSPVSFFQIVVGTAVLAQHLFAMRLPVRGSITSGEAEAIPGTNHLVGRAIVRAAKLEKAQDWFGVIIDPEILDEKHRAMLQIPLVGPLVVSYPVPVKEGSGLGRELHTINWRFNLSAEHGVASLLPQSSDPSAMKKRENTLAYCRFLRERQLAWGQPMTAKGEPFLVPWMRGVHIGNQPPGHSSSAHGDDY